MKIIAFINLKKVIVIVFCLAFLISSCSDNDTATAPEVAGPVEVINISPTAGPSATLVTITGKNFSPMLADNTVSINGKPATVVTASATQLTVTVPPAAESGLVAVTTKGQLAQNKPTFTFFWSVSTLAGSNKGYVNGLEAKFSVPSGVSADADGNVFVTDFGNHVIRKVTPAGMVNTSAGSKYGIVNGAALSSKFIFPNGSAIDKLGNLYISEEGSHLIRKIAPSGEVSTFAGGNFMYLFPNGDTLYVGGYANGPATTAKFSLPSGIAVDDNGNVYVADQINNRIRKITPGGEVSTLAGSTQGSADGIGEAAQFYRPVGLAVDVDGNVFVGDLFNHRIRKITSAGVVTTVAGSNYGFADGMNTSAKFAFPAGLALDKQGNLYVADSENHRIRKITPAGEVSTFAGTASQGTANGIATLADFYLPREIDIDKNGIMYVVEVGNHRVRKID